VSIKDFYIDGQGRPRRNGIYCPVFDRWLLIDDFDFWVTLDTAKVLSSKIASTVYLLPNRIFGMTNSNCLNYAIFDKTKHKSAGSTDLVRGQIPSLKVFKGAPSNLTDPGYPEDYKTPEGIDALHKLKRYAEVTQKYMYAIKLTQEVTNFVDNKTFTQEYVNDYLVNGLEPYYDRIESEMSFVKKIRTIFYEAYTIEQAEAETKEFLDNHQRIGPHLKKHFFELIEGDSV